ncbi:chitin-binding protein [Saccharopolyspora kobensis]|uniref:Chitin-binding protein n=1 Tax=Saccharopolyspora kobensis TaxID=146035 RepID=A0A1H5XBD8_9PSEU|nr:lytic polysaccharide monooxygenase auxiliary activity family 9 protein [Saccharopolyspora kobensis]SEG09048.1 chitin-binding protein [Saccharopolyspora kobensis]SFE45037.1 chitin-binding protein [Saccharopolyspora kobensis]
MNKKPKLAAAIVGAAIAPFLVAIPTSTASAHGYIDSPPSRQAQCAKGTVPCGPIKYEPQSVEGPKGLTSCSGGNQAFGELDDDSKGWTATPVGNSVNFNWTITARHATSTWEYFIGGNRVAVFDDGGKQPPSQFSHTVDLGGVSGKQKLLAVWNVADTANAFYACVDLNVGAK